jgi:hypothetical protein
MASTTGYIQFPIVTDTNAIIQTALTNIARTITGWVPREGNLEVALVEQFAYMASEAANVASDVPKSIFRYYGQLVGITPQDGVKSQIQTTWTLVNPATGDQGYNIPANSVAGFYYEGNALQYTTPDTAVNIPAGATSANVVMTAVDVGTAYNVDSLANFTAVVTFLQPNPNNPYISQVKILSSPANNPSLTVGVDAESDASYLNRLSAELQFLAPRAVTANDFAAISTNVPGVYRSAALDGFNPFANRMRSFDALTGPQTGGTTASWVPVGDGSHSPTITAQTSGAPLTITTSSTAMGSTYLVNPIAAGDTTATIKGQIVFAASTSAPVFLYVDDTPGGAGEVLVVTSVATNGSGGGATYTVNFPYSPAKYAHTNVGSGYVIVKVLQGAKLPNVAGLASNSLWYQLGTSVKCGTDTAGAATPIVVGVAVYSNASVAAPGKTFSSANPYGGDGGDYTSWQKTVVANIDGFASSALAPLASAPYSSIGANIVNVTPYILFLNANTSVTHLVYNTSLNQVQFDFSTNGKENPQSLNDDYNWVPDSSFFAYNSSSTSSWKVPSGSNFVVLPGFGVQLIGTGSALGSALNVDSQLFSLSNVSTSPFAGTRTYTVYANVDTSYTGTTYGNFNLTVLDSAGATLATVTPVDASIQMLVATFTLAAGKTAQVRLNFNTGLTVAAGASILVSQIGVISNSYTTSTLPKPYRTGYIWSPGDQYVANSYIAPRSVTVVPVQLSGLPSSSTVAQKLDDYLTSYREVNFQVYAITPNYVPIDVAWTATVNPGYNTGTVQSAGNTAVRNFLSPANWGGGNETPPKWDVTRTGINILDIAGILSQVDGIAAVTNIKICITGGTLATTSIGLSGVAPMPIANNVLGTVYANSSDVALGSV